MKTNRYDREYRRATVRALAIWAAAILFLVGCMVYAERADAAPHRPGVHKARTCYTLMGERHCTVRWVHHVNRGQR